MRKNIKQNEVTISEENILKLVPIHNKEFKYNESGCIDILVPRSKIEFIQRLLPESRKYMCANLDELGTTVWNLIDGKQNIEEIAKLLEEKYGEKVEPVLKRLTLFLRNLYQNNFIIFNKDKEK